MVPHYTFGVFVGAAPCGRPFRLIWCPFPRRAGACPSRRVYTAPFDWERDFAAPAASPFWSDPKGAKRSPGVCSDGQVTSILIWMWPAHSRYTPGPPFTGELDSGAWCNCTGAGWPLTYRRSPARCHCAAKPESYRLYPLKRASTGRSPVVRRVSDGTISSLCRLFSVPRPRGVHPIGGDEMGAQWKSSTSDFHWERTSSGRSESCPFGRDE